MSAIGQLVLAGCCLMGLLMGSLAGDNGHLTFRVLLSISICAIVLVAGGKLFLHSFELYHRRSRK